MRENLNVMIFIFAMLGLVLISMKYSYWMNSTELFILWNFCFYVIWFEFAYYYEQFKKLKKEKTNR